MSLLHKIKNNKTAFTKAFRKVSFWKKTLCSALIVSLLGPYLQAPVEALFFSDEQQEVLASTQVSPEVKNTQLVAVLVEESLLENNDLKERIERYGQDVQMDLKAKVVQIPIPRETSPFEIYEGLSHLYFSGLKGDGLSQLIGTVLIGDIPLPVVEKNKNYWPTVYPYVDFEHPAYYWDPNKERFMYQGGDDEPEIWHGVINPMVDGRQAKEQELKDYLDFNHQVHKGEVPFSKKVFYADFFHQKKVLPEMLYNHYQRWIRYAEEIFYLRFTKHFAKKVLEEFEEEGDGMGIGVASELSEAQKNQIIQQAMAAGANMTADQIREQMDMHAIDQMPDVLSKMLSQNFLKRYQEAYQSWLSRLGGKVEKMGRWQAEEVDTTISLITKKDESSALLLQSVNEAMEEVLGRELIDKNIAEHIPVYPTIKVPIPDEEGGGAFVIKPQYWNGVERGMMDAEDCTLMRGYPRDEEYAFAQQVEAIRTLNPKTAESCKHRDEPGRTSDPYEGCCAKNMEYKGGNFSYHTCDTGSLWIFPTVHQGAEREVFDITGTRELEGDMGASGCAPILRFDNEEPAHRFYSLFTHDEPRAESITEQVQSAFSRALPIDDPRGVSFYDHGRRFQRVAFPNIFNFRDLEGIDAEEAETKNLIIQGVKESIEAFNAITEEGNKLSNERMGSDSALGWLGDPATPPKAPEGGSVEGDCNYRVRLIQIDKFTHKRTWIEDCGWTVTGPGADGTPPSSPSEETMTANNVISHYYETGDLIDADAFVGEVFETIGWEDILESLYWIDKDIEQKNRIALEKALSPTKNFQDFFYDQQSDGYELFQITSEGDPVKGLKMAFLPEINNTEDEEYLDVLNGIAHFGLTKGRPKIPFMGKDFEKDVLGVSRTAEGSDIPESLLENKDKFVDAPEKAAEEETKKADWAPVVEKWASDFAGKGISFVDMGPDAGKARKTKPASLAPNFGDNDLPQIDDLFITPTEIRIAANEVSPVKVEVLLRDGSRRVVDTDFETKVKLAFKSSDASKFFTIMPAQDMSVEAGKATFFLIPKTQDIGGQFDMVATGKGKTSETVSVKITNQDLKVLANVSEPVVVKDKKGMLVRARIQDLKGELLTTLDGEMLTFSSEWGTFQGNNEAVIENGLAKTLFFPGEKAGRATITGKDKKKRLPMVDFKFDIEPAEPSFIQIKVPSQYFVPSQVFMPLAFQVIDDYGNNINLLRHNVTWELEGLDVQEEETIDNESGEKGIQQSLRRGKSDLLVRPKSGASEVSISIKSDAGAGISSRARLKILDKALLKVEATHESITVGSEELVHVSVQAQTGGGELLDGDFKVTITPSQERILSLPREIDLFDGKGEFVFYADTKASELSIALNASGFEPIEIPFEVLPDVAKKIKMSSTQDFLNLSEDKPAIVDIAIVDQFGNQVKYFSGNVSVRLTELTQELLKLEKTTISIQKGKGIFKIWGKELAGKAHLIAEGNELIPAALEIELANFFSAKHLSSFYPKSILAMLLGFGAGDVRFSENFADRFLFSGETQSVATLIADPNPKYRYVSLAPSGEFLGKSKAEFNFSTFPEVRFIDQAEDEAVSFARLLFGNKPDIKLGKKGDATGIYIDFKDSLKEDIKLKKTEQGTEVLLEGEQLFFITGKGGVLRGERYVEFKSDDSIRDWRIYLDEEKVGELTFVLSDTLYPVDYLRAEGASGIMLKAVIPKTKTEEIFVGNSTHGNRGLAVIDSEKKENSSRKLNSGKISIEDAPKKESVGWTSDWKPAAHFAAQNAIGTSTQMASGESFILLGDPSLSLKDRNEETDFGFSQDLGKPIWKSLEGEIEQVFSGDVNGDGVLDLLTRVRDKLYVLYQTESKDIEIGDEETYFLPKHNFRETGPLLRFADGVENIIALDNNRDKLIDFIHLNKAGQLIYHWNRGGKYERKPVDLELKKKIVNLKSGRLNNDLYTDIALLDEENNLYLAYGHEDGFFTPQYLDNFSPNFASAEESFPIKKEEDKTKYLDALRIAYEGLSKEVSDGDDVVQMSDPDKDHQEVDITHLAQAFNPEAWEQISFMPIPQNNTFQATYSLKLNKEENPVVKPGDEIEVSFSIKPSKNLEDFQFQPPVDSRLEPKEGSLSCEGCEGEVQLKSTQGQGAFWAHGINLKKNVKTLFTWKLMVVEVPEVTFFIGDFESKKDDIDDISVPWEDDDGNPQIIYFRSSERHSQRPGWTASTTEGGSVQSNQHQKQTEDVKPKEDPQESFKKSFGIDEKDPAGTLTDLRERLIQDSDGDGYPDNWDAHPNTPNSSALGSAQSGTLTSEIGVKSEEINDSKSDLICGGGTCFGIPISIAFFAPGLITGYFQPQSPYAYPIGMEPGFPITQFPTTLWTPPPVPAIWQPILNGMPGMDPLPTVGDGVFASQLRIYLMPTTTGKYAQTVCTQTYTPHMIAPLWMPNCYTAVLTPAHAPGICPATGEDPNILISNAGGFASSDSGSLVSVSASSENKSNFSAEVAPEKNIQIPGVDRVMTWMQDQTRELGETLTAPSLSVKMPNFDRNAMSNASSFDFQSGTGGSVESVYSALSNTPFLDVKVEDITIPYPNFSEAELAKMKTDFVEWKKDATGKLSENSIADFEDNLNTAEDYYNGRQELITLREDLEYSLAQTVESVQTLSDFLDNWLLVVDRRIQEWEQAKEIKTQILNIWQIVPQIFIDFDISCRTCIVDRGTLLPWLLDVFIGGQSFPLIKLPRPPDMTMDFSNIGGKLQITLPNPVLELVDISVFNLPSTDHLPDLEGDIAPPKKLPPLADVDKPNKVPALKLPQLPVPPPPPTLPDLLGSFLGILSLPRAYLNLFCLLRLGVAPTPEWYVKPYVEQLTNREFLLEYDFGYLSILPLNFLNKEVSVIASMGHLLNYSALLEVIKGVGNALNTIASGMGQQGRGGSTPSPTMSIGKEIQAMNAKNIPAIAEFRDWAKGFQQRVDNSRGYSDTKTLLAQMKEEASQTIVKSDLQNDIRNKVLALEVPEMNLDHPLRKQVKSRMGEIKEKLIALNEKIEEENHTLLALKDLSPEEFYANKEVQDIFNPNTSFFASGEKGVSIQDAEMSLPRDALKGLMAFANTTTPSIAEAEPLALEEGTDDAGAQESGAGENYVEPGIYFVDADTGLTEKITKFPVFGTEAMLIVDIDDDDTEEIIYAIGNELYLKERFVKTEEVSPETKIEKWDFETFQEKFSPVQEVQTSTRVSGANLNFERVYEDLPYFEWIISDRPDYVFEHSFERDKQKSEFWERHGFFVSEDPVLGVLRQTPARVIDYQGTPKLTSKPFEKVRNFDEDECENQEIEKTMFLEEGHFYAQEKSKLKYRMLKRGWEGQPYTELTLAEGEEVYLESAEMCLYKGVLLKELFGPTEEVPITENILLTSEASLVLSEGDEVTLLLSDGREIEIFSGERYFFESVLEEETFISDKALLEKGNYYGFVKAWKEDGTLESFIYPKLLHDPQSSDDKTPPGIILMGGNKQKMAVHQKLLLDASGTSDEQALIDVWWDFDGAVDSDGDGDPQNDRDFPFDTVTYTPKDLLKIKIPSRDSTQIFEVILYAQDTSGNTAKKVIEIEMIAPDLEIYDASEGDGVIRGRLEESYEEVPVWFLREREGSETFIRQEPVYTDAKGYFELKDVADGEGSEIIDQQTGRTVIEMLETGRPIILDNRLGFHVQGANILHPIRIRVRDEKNVPLALIDFELATEASIEIIDDIKFGDETIQIVDRNPKDRITFKPFPEDTTLSGQVAMVDEEAHKTIGIIDQKGGIYPDLGEGIDFQIKKAFNEDDPVVFEIRKDKVVIGEAYIPVDGIKVSYPSSEEKTTHSKEDIAKKFPISGGRDSISTPRKGLENAAKKENNLQSPRSFVPEVVTSPERRLEDEFKNLDSKDTEKVLGISNASSLRSDDNNEEKEETLNSQEKGGIEEGLNKNKNPLGQPQTSEDQGTSSGIKRGIQPIGSKNKTNTGSGGVARNPETDNSKEGQSVWEEFLSKLKGWIR